MARPAHCKAITWGQPYGETPWITARGRHVWMFRKRQGVRWFDCAGKQVGPEERNVGPAVVNAMGKGWQASHSRAHGVLHVLKGARRARRSGALRGAQFPSSFEAAKAVADTLNADAKRLGDVLRQFPRNSMGLVSDTTRVSPEYRAAKDAYDRAFANLRRFNTVYTKRFANEIRAARRR